MLREEDLKKIARLKPGERLPWSLSHGEYFTYQVFQALLGVIDSFDQLERALFYLGSKGKSQTKKPPRYTDWTWLEYHVAYFVIIYSAIFDRALILTNEVFQLGNPPKNCKPEIIKSNTSISKEVLDALEGIERCSLKLREERNVLLHRGHSIDIAKMLNSELLDKLKLFYSVKGLSSDYAGPPFLAIAMKMERRNVKATFEKYAKDAESATRTLLDALKPIYERKKG